MFLLSSSGRNHLEDRSHTCPTYDVNGDIDSVVNVEHHSVSEAKSDKVV